MKAHRVSADRVAFHCPGCDCAHVVNSAPGGWTFNGDFERPTLSPSVLVTTGHYIDVKHCWCKFNEEHPEAPSGFTCSRCHSFVRDGRIQFLADSTHALAGKTVDLPAWGEP